MRRLWLAVVVVLALVGLFVTPALAADPATETVTVDLSGQLPFFDSPSTGSLRIVRTGTSLQTADTWELNLGLRTGTCTGSGKGTEAWDETGGTVTLTTRDSWNCSIFLPEFPLSLRLTPDGDNVYLLGVPFAVVPALKPPFSGQSNIGLNRDPAGVPWEFNILHGRFYMQASGSFGRGYGIRDGGQNGGTDPLGHPIPFWTLFKRLGAIDALGYPVSHVFPMGGLYYQAFQRGLLQWLPDAQIAQPANTMDYLHDQGLDALLESKYLVPPQENDITRTADEARRDRLGALVNGGTGDGWLTNAAIKAKFIAKPTELAVSKWSGAYTAPDLFKVDAWGVEDAINIYGLPTSKPVDRGDFIVQRFQRGALQYWVNDVTGMPPKGSVVGVLVGDMAKLNGVLPATYMVPERLETTP